MGHEEIATAKTLTRHAEERDSEPGESGIKSTGCTRHQDG